MIYFDNAATGGYKPDNVVNAASAALQYCANPGRSGHRLSLACLERVYNCRKQLCSFFGGYSYDRVIFTKNCTEALNIAILGVFKEGDKIVTTVAEHNSVLRPLEYLKSKGVKVGYAPLNAAGEIDIDALAAMTDSDTRAVIVTLASNVIGTAPDIAKIRRAIPENTCLICDGAQACGHVGINMKRDGIDALAVAGHKGMLGIQGSGALLFSERLNPSPVLMGGTGSESFNLHMPDFYPDRLESGTLSYPAIVSLGEGVLYLNEHMDADSEKVIALTKNIDCELREEGIRPYSRPNPYGIVAFNLNNMQSEAAAYRLSEEYGICVRGGLHCAPLMHRALNSEGLIRASLSAFNTLSECDRFMDAVIKLNRE